MTTGHHETRWRAGAAIVAVAAVQLVLPESLSLGPRWVLPAIELVLLGTVLSANPNRLTAESRDMRRVSLVLVGVLGLANALSLGLLVDALLADDVASGRELILAALGVWLTNVVVFALLFWEIDRRGPHARSTGEEADPDLLFPQMSLDGQRFASWAPAFEDYLYVSFTNCTAFSPTDTMPLTRRIKMIMLAQALLSLITIALVGARAVNILG